MKSADEPGQDPAHLLYEQLLKDLGPKARRSLERIRSACNTIALARGAMTYSRVAKVAVERFGGPANQTILNNKQLKAYIDARALADRRSNGRSNAPGPASASGLSRRTEQYPSEGLDAKTMACIDMLRAEVARNEQLILTLQKTLESQTKRSPLSFEEALRLGPGRLTELQLPLVANGNNMPIAMRRALTSVLTGEVATLQVEVRDGKQRLAGTRQGTLEILLSPFQWTEALEWLRRCDVPAPSRT